MKLDRVRPIADTILYEGYVLYPYRASSLKNRRRWTFGSLSPRAEPSFDPLFMESSCLVESSRDTSIEAVARFLHLFSRPAGDVDAWEDAIERQVITGSIAIGHLAEQAHRQRFRFEPGDVVEGARQEAIEGEIQLSAALVRPGVHRLTVRVSNTTAGPVSDRLLSLGSAHAVLGVEGGALVSMLDPPEALREAVEACRQTGAWPVLVGSPGDRDLMLCSPIILYDYPAVAPESPGDFFDATEMDEMLTLRILTLSEPEKIEAARLDDRVRALLERTARLAPEDLGRLHGAIRSPGGRPRTTLSGVGPGDRVRLCPSGRSDVFDLALAGQAATVVSIEQDYEDRVFVTVTVDDDPGADLGARSLPGHRFFFRPDEIELLSPAARARG